MKAFIVFALIVAITSAYYVPEWTAINPSGSAFKISSVLSQNFPIPTQNNILQVCGTAAADISVASFNYQIGRDSTVWFSGVVNVPPQNIFNGGNYCFFFNFQVPTIAAPRFSVMLTLNNPLNPNYPHAQVQINYKI